MDSIANKNAKISKTIHLIRHGQTDFNKQNIIQGSGINSDLNDTGKRQAELFFKSHQFNPYSRIYTSKLNRSIQSVEPFIKKGIPHTELEALNEINWGIMEGRAGSPENAALYNEIVSQWSSGNLDLAIENGESPNSMYNRQKTGLEHIMSREEEEFVLICMHGRALRSFLCLLTNTPLKDMEQWHHHNLCLYELAYNGSHFDIVKANDVSHLNEINSFQ
ncbi:MAG TPA: histidine phosphatase family protein [Bacteroidia bacterium]